MKEGKQVHGGEHWVGRECMRKGGHGGGEMRKGRQVGEEHGVREGVIEGGREGREGINEGGDAGR